MRKLFAVFAVLILSSTMLTGCLPLEILEVLQEEADAVKEFVIEDYGVTITTPGEWDEVEDTDFDIQLRNDLTHFSVYAYHSIDLAKDQTPESIYEWQNEDLFSKRENVEIVEEPITYSSNGKTIIRTLYSAEKEGTKFYYSSSLVTFDDNEDVFAWVLVSAIPSEMIQNRDEYIEMIDSMQADMSINM